MGAGVTTGRLRKEIGGGGEKRSCPTAVVQRHPRSMPQTEAAAGGGGVNVFAVPGISVCCPLTALEGSV